MLKVTVTLRSGTVILLVAECTVEEQRTIMRALPSFAQECGADMGEYFGATWNPGITTRSQAERHAVFALNAKLEEIDG